MPTIGELLRRYVKGHDFGPDDSTVLSSIAHPVKAAGMFGDFVGRNVNQAMGVDPYDNPTPYYGQDDAQKVNSALTLAGLMQTGAMPFGPTGKGTLGAIPVWHGSPHKFDEFDMSKIGTGEGAQMYGKGLYFAESPEVAETYRKGLSNTSYFANDELKFFKTKLLRDKYSDIEDALLRNKFDVEKSKNEVLNKYKKILSKFDNPLYKGESWNSDEARKKLIEQIDFVQSLDIKENNGSLYKASLEWGDPAREAADPLGPHHFLDWDRPLSEQQEVWRKLKDAGMNKFTGNDAGSVYKPRDIQYTSELSEAGIPGIRYLDQGSRGIGEGTANYVVFDDKIPKIVERNGVTISDLLEKMKK